MPFKFSLFSMLERKKCEGICGKLVPSFIFSNMCKYCERKRRRLYTYRKYSVTTLSTS